MRIHFVGIGGVSMRQLAVLLEAKGYEISGSDIAISGHDARNVEGADAVVYTAAVKQDNVELVRARELGLPIIERAVLLGKVSDMHKNSIAVGGTHGKTTVTGMLWAVFSHLEPTVHMGGVLQSSTFQKTLSSGISALDEFFITEACEYNRSFLNLSPSLSVVLNIDLDHTDCYKDTAELSAAFAEFAKRAKNAAVINADDPLTAVLPSKKIITFGLNSAADYTARSLSADGNGCFGFFAYKHGIPFGAFKLSVAGIHNVKNALAAIAAADYYGIPLKNIQEGLYSFSGVSRRFELAGYLKPEIVQNNPATACPAIDIARSNSKTAIQNTTPLPSSGEGVLCTTERQRPQGAIAKNNSDAAIQNTTPIAKEYEGCGFAPSDAKIRVYSDYAHHPKEIECSILTARAAGAGNLIAVFEPHTYSRTQSFLDGFADSLMLADKIILLPVYAARETDEHKISSLDLWRKIRKANKPTIYFSTYAEAARYLKSTAKAGDTLLLMGAGDIDKLAKNLIE